MYGAVPPEGVAVHRPLVRLEVAPVELSVVGESETETPETRAIDTETEAVVVWPNASVTVHVAVPVSVVPEEMLEAVNEVVADVGELIVIPVPPEVNAQE